MSTNNLLLNQGITIFTIPVTNGQLTISSSNKSLGTIEIVNNKGQVVYTTQGNGVYNKQIDKNHLSPGVYFINLVGTGKAKFIIR